jgi:hypothetical protein
MSCVFVGDVLINMFSPNNLSLWLDSINWLEQGVSSTNYNLGDLHEAFQSSNFEYKARMLENAKH